MKKISPYYLILVVLIIVYAVLTFATPPNANILTRYSLSESQARLLSLTVIIPLIAIWFTAFYGFIKVKEYSSLADGSKDGHGMKLIAQGLMLFAISLPLNSILSAGRNYLVHNNPNSLNATTIVYNYLSLLIVLVGAWLISHGSRRLAGTLTSRQASLNQSLLAASFTAFCIVYTYVTLNQSSRHVGSETVATMIYHLPDYMIFSTIVVPYILLWFLGFRSAYHILLYRDNVKGVLYKKALGNLAFGIVFVMISLMALRLTVSLSASLDSLTLRYLLAFIYLLLLLIGIGYLYIALGAKKLKKIEEV